MTEPAENNELPVYENVDTAPFVYFDISPAHGIMGGAIQIELASRILNAVSDGSVEIKFITTGRLRCSPTAAMPAQRDRCGVEDVGTAAAGARGVGAAELSISIR